jgi:uncharacterized membrane protein
MHYLIALLSCALVLGLQYFLSHWLIKIGWFYGYAWVMGGFVLWFFVAVAIVMQFFPLLKNKSKKLSNMERIEQGNHESNATKLCAILVLLGGFWLNLKLNDFHEKYEYETFGIKTKAFITKKYTLQNKGKSYIFILKTQEKPQQKELTHNVSSGEYAIKNVGDTIAIFYSPRYSSMIKLLATNPKGE